MFNGDFVDRGSWSTEVVLTVFMLKWLFPSKIFVSRAFPRPFTTCADCHTIQLNRGKYVVRIFHASRLEADTGS